MLKSATIGVLFLLLAACGTETYVTDQQIDEDVSKYRDQVKKEWEAHWGGVRIGTGTPGGFNEDVTEFAKQEFWKRDWPLISKAFDDSPRELRKSTKYKSTGDLAARQAMIRAEAQKLYDKTLAAKNLASQPVTPPGK